MKYREYLDTAKRHLATCQTFFDSVNWEIVPSKIDLLKKKTILQKEKILYFEQKTSLFKKRISFLKKKISSLNIQTLQNAHSLSIEQIKKQTELVCQLKNCIILLRNQKYHIQEKGYSLECQKFLFEEASPQLDDCQTKLINLEKLIKKNSDSLEPHNLPSEETRRQIDNCIVWLNNLENLLKKTNLSLEQQKSLLEKRTCQVDEDSDWIDNQERQSKESDRSLEQVESDLNTVYDLLEKNDAKLEKIDNFINEINILLGNKKDLIENSNCLLKIIIDKLNELIKKISTTVKNVNCQQNEKNTQFDDYLKWLDQQKTLTEKDPSEQMDLYTEERFRRLEIYKTLLEEKNKSSQMREKQLKENDDLLKKEFNLFKTKLERKDYLLKDIYYLTGYILEALTVYVAYEGTITGFEGNMINGFQGNEITDLDLHFTKATHIDYYKSRKDNGKWKSCRNRENKELNKLINELKEKELTNKKNNPSSKEKFFFDIQSHDFYQIITNVLNKRSVIENRCISDKVQLLSSISNISIDDGALRNKVITLIENWNPKIRYSEKECEIWKTLKAEKALRKEPLKQLIKLCNDIFTEINHP